MWHKVYSQYQYCGPWVRMRNLLQNWSRSSPNSGIRVQGNSLYQHYGLAFFSIRNYVTQGILTASILWTMSPNANSSELEQVESEQRDTGIFSISALWTSFLQYQEQCDTRYTRSINIVDQEFQCEIFFRIGTTWIGTAVYTTTRYVSIMDLIS